MKQVQTKRQAGPTLVPLEIFAKEVGISRSLAYKLANEDQIPVIRLGRLFRVNMVAWRKRLESVE
jgi:predicted DNA-binding transcriptional regulator AlpA